MNTRIQKSEKGFAIVGVLVFTLIYAILGFSVLNLARSEVALTETSVNKTQAFYLAEAGLGRLPAKLRSNDLESIDDTELGEGSYRVDIYYDENPPYAVSTGMVGGEESKIKVELSFLARPYEEAIYAGNSSGQKFTFVLRGTGNPQELAGGREVGGKDTINGDIFADRAVAMYEESSINPPPLPNTNGLKGDVDATETVSVNDSASISGDIRQGVEAPGNPDLLGMNYHINNTHNVSQIFAEQGISGGYLPSGHELHDVVVKNPGDRANECAGTPGDDYFIEPSTISSAGSKKSGGCPVNLGDDRVYYIDGNVWIHNKQTYGLVLDGKATIVATGNIYICDNTEYNDSESLLGLVALGQYDNGDQLVNGGNIYFGDPRYGTTYNVCGLMFAANDFLYNTDSITGESAEPETGFSIYGNLGAMNHVSVNREWYDPDGFGDPRAAYFDHSESASGKWVDIETGAELTAAELDSLRHYQMKVSYDERVRSQDTQPPGLPRQKAGAIFAGLTNWGEVP